MSETAKCPDCGAEGPVRDWLAGESLDGVAFLVWCPGGTLVEGDRQVGTLPRTVECLKCGNTFEIQGG